MKNSIWSLIIIGLAVNSTLFLLSLLGRLHWILEILSHLLMQYGLGFVLLGLPVLVLKRSRIIGVTSLIFGFCILFYCNLSPTKFGQIVKLDKHHSLVNYNLLSQNRDARSAISEINRLDADFVCFQEYNQFWQDNLTGLDQYPFRVEKVQEGHFGIAIYSKFPFQKQEIKDFTKGPFPSIWIEYAGDFHNPIGILNTHIEPPIGYVAHQYRLDHFTNMTRFLNAQNCAYIITGDLNTTPYSYHFKDLCQDLDLQDSRSTQVGIQASWPDILGIFGIPIDHVLGSDKIIFKNRCLGLETGSDHIPVKVEFH